MEISKTSTGFLEPVVLSDIKLKLLSRVRHNKIVENIGAYLPGARNQPHLSQASGSQKRKVPLDMHTSTPATKKQTMQPCSSKSLQKISLPVDMVDDLYTSMTNSTFSHESGYCSFESQNSRIINSV